MEQVHSGICEIGLFSDLPLTFVTVIMYAIYMIWYDNPAIT